MTIIGRPGRLAENARFGIFLFFLACCFLWGGASRLDVPGLILLQPLSLACLVTLLLIPGTIDWVSIRVPLVMLGTLAGIMVVQLIALPPAVWATLPGHARFLEGSAIAGIDELWRPLSLTPDLTLASLVGLIIPLTALVGFASIPVARTYRFLPVLLIGVAFSAVLGLAQIAGGARSPFYLYSVTNIGSPVGFFSNRNHQAVLLAMAWPMLALWTVLPRGDKLLLLRRAIAASAAAFLVLLMAATGSRAGLVLGPLALALAWWEWHLHLTPAERNRGKPLLRTIAPVAIISLLVASTFWFSRDEAIQRAFATSVADEARLQSLPVLLTIARDFLPFGSGFGSFDPVFRVYEPFDLLSPTYLNHAHNDLLELLITAGLPGALLAVAFVVWACRRGYGYFRKPGLSRADSFGRLATVMILCMGLSSFVDYPLRTPLLSAVFAIACGWLSAGGRDRDAGGKLRRG
jgi:O-antigen ligase